MAAPKKLHTQHLCSQVSPPVCVSVICKAGRKTLILIYHLPNLHLQLHVSVGSFQGFWLHPSLKTLEH